MIRLSSLLLIVSLLFCACQSSRTSYEVSELAIEPGVTTKEELIQQLGAPRGIRMQGEDTVLTFIYGEANGLGYGIGSFAVPFMVESLHAGIDTLVVVIGPDRIVRSFRLSQNPKETPKWPSE